MATRPPTLVYRRLVPAKRRRRVFWTGIAVVGGIIAIALMFQFVLLFALRR